jgi:tetratricopeptide (TPR) repeat protein
LRTILIIVLSFSFYTAANAQAALPDSVERLVEGMKHDSTYIIRLNALASGYLKSNPASSRQIAAYVIDNAPKIKDTRGYARALVVMGNSYWYEGIYEFAQNYYLLAARQYRTLNDSLGLAQVYNNMGEVNKRLGELDMALEYLLRSLDMKRADSTRAMTLYNIGELFITMGKYENATEYLDQSTALAKANDNERIIAYNYWSIARIKAEQGLYKEAFQNYEEAEKLWTKLGETRSLIQTYQDIAYTHRLQNHTSEALQFLNKASKLSTKINVPDLRITTYMEHFKLDSVAGNYKRAMYYLSRHNALKDSVYNLLKAEQIARVQAIYETEIHERENRELRIEKELQESQLATRDLLIGGVSGGLVIVLVLAIMLFREHKKNLNANKDLQAKNEEISFQKNAIETQAEALLRLNEELKDLNKSLEGRIDERTKQLFLQNKKLAEYAFVNAHKLRAPIASILGLIDLFSKADPSEQQVILKHLKTCGEDLDNTIRNINVTLEEESW